jgi:hypothetical protein
MIRRAKILELMKMIDLSIFGSNMFLTLKIYGFENVTLIKKFHIYMIEGMNV